MRIYISGPITGYADNNEDAFAVAKIALLHNRTKLFPTVATLVVVNPLELPLQDAAGQTWHSYLKRDLAELLTCDAVATLPGWQESNGASLEVHVAKALGLTVKPLAAWLEGK